MGFLSNLVHFENLFSKNVTKDVFHDPWRLVTGVDPASTKVWNTALGQDKQPLVNVYGSPGQQYYDQAKAEGIDTGAAEKFHGLADKVANYYAMQGIGGIGGGATGAGTDSGGSGMGIMDMFSSGGDSGGGSGWGSALGGLLGAAGSYYDSKKNADAAKAGTNESSTSTTLLDPGIAKLLGLGGNGGILGGLGNSMSGGSNLSQSANDFIKGTAPQILNNGYWNTQQLNSSQFTAPTIQAAQIDAPSQNNINLSPTFQRLLAGGDTSALMQSLQAGNNLTNAQFHQNTGDVTDSLMKTVLPSIRSNSVLAGQYGGSRQGVAEGNAISDYTKQLTNGATQVGLANSANTAGQLANNYEQGQNRSLSAAQSLSGQQYSVAAANAAARQAADNTNVAALQATRGLNSSNLATGTGLQQNLLNNASSLGNSDLTRLGQTAGILAPFLGAGATTNTTGNATQPAYQNTAANVLGGALAGSQLANMFGQNNAGSSSFGIGAGSGANAGKWFNGTSWVPMGS